MYCLIFLFTTNIEVNSSPLLWHITAAGPPHSDIDVTTTENKAPEPIILKNKKSDIKQSILIIFLLCNLSVKFDYCR